MPTSRKARETWSTPVISVPTFKEDGVILAEMSATRQHARELERGHRNRATLAVARKLVTYLLAVDKSGQSFQLRTLLPQARAE